MKKVLLLSLILAVGMTGFAQTKNQAIKAPKLKVGTADVHKRAMGKQEAVQAYQYQPSTSVASTRYEYLNEYASMWTNYDLQGNGFVANRMALFKDGAVGVTATFSQAGTAAAPDRGTGYNLILPDGELLFPDGPEARIEEEKTGWPSYAQWGEDGEIVVAHTTVGTMVCYTREHKGEGEWTRHELPNPNLGVEAQELTWPRVITSGPNHNIIHVIAADQCAEPNLGTTYTYYARSTDAETWEVGFMPTLDEDGEEGLYSADYYALAANGNTVAILLTGDIMAHTYILKSTDNGETWNKIKVWDNPYAGMDWETDENSLFGEDNAMYGPETGAICIDNDGMVHAAFSAHHYFHAELGTGYTTIMACQSTVSSTGTKKCMLITTAPSLLQFGTMTATTVTFTLKAPATTASACGGQLTMQAITLHATSTSLLSASSIQLWLQNGTTTASTIMTTPATSRALQLFRQSALMNQALSPSLTAAQTATVDFTQILTISEVFS